MLQNEFQLPCASLDSENLQARQTRWKADVVADCAGGTESRGLMTGTTRIDPARCDGLVKPDQCEVVQQPRSAGGVNGEPALSGSSGAKRPSARLPEPDEE